MNFFFMLLIGGVCVWYGLGGENRMSMICSFRKLYQQAKEEMRGKKNAKKEIKTLDSKGSDSSSSMADTSVEKTEEIEAV
jgi:hypothetical protein